MHARTSCARTGAAVNAMSAVTKLTGRGRAIPCVDSSSVHPGRPRSTPVQTWRRAVLGVVRCATPLGIGVAPLGFSAAAQRHS
jgi:hypothetical protein